MPRLLTESGELFYGEYRSDDDNLHHSDPVSCEPCMILLRTTPVKHIKHSHTFTPATTIITFTVIVECFYSLYHEVSLVVESNSNDNVNFCIFLHSKLDPSSNNVSLFQTRF